MTPMKHDLAPWLLLPSIVLALSTVTLLAPHEAVQAAPASAAQPEPKTPVYDDGDGDELLEHWGDPQYSREERWQLGGMTGGFLALAATGVFRRSRHKSGGAVVSLPSEADFLKLDSSAASTFRKAA